MTSIFLYSVEVYQEQYPPSPPPLPCCHHLPTHLVVCQMLLLNPEKHIACLQLLSMDPLFEIGKWYTFQIHTNHFHNNSIHQTAKTSGSLPLTTFHCWYPNVKFFNLLSNNCKHFTIDWSRSKENSLINQIPNLQSGYDLYNSHLTIIFVDQQCSEWMITNCMIKFVYIFFWKKQNHSHSIYQNQ